PGNTVPSSSARSAGPASPTRGSTIDSARGSGGCGMVGGAITGSRAGRRDGCAASGRRVRACARASGLLPGLSGPEDRPLRTGDQDAQTIAPGRAREPAVGGLTTNAAEDYDG